MAVLSYQPQGGGDCLYQGRKVCSGAVVTILQYSKLVRVCDRGVLRYKQSRLVDNNSIVRKGGGYASKEGKDISHTQAFG